jgi:hypothetical protein
MNATMQTAIDGYIARLSRKVKAPKPPLAWGVDLSCITDIDDRASEVRADSPTAIGQAVARRLITPRGMVSDDLAYGFDLRGLCNTGVPAGKLAQLSSDIAAEARKDERVSSVDCSCTYSYQTRALRVQLSILPVGALSDFDFVFSVVDGAVLVERLL